MEASLERSIGNEIRVLSNMIHRTLANMPGTKQIEAVTGTNAWIIGYIAQQGDSNVYQRDLEQKFGITRSTASKVVNLMVQKGLIVRHMVMPNGVEDSMDILTWIAGNLPLDDILVSVMSQYTPFYKSGEYPEIDRRLTAKEYDRVLDWLDCMGIENGFVQELSSAKEEYTPDFSLQGV